MREQHSFRRADLMRCEIAAEQDAIAAVHHLLGYLPDAGYLAVIGVLSRRPAMVAVVPPRFQAHGIAQLLASLAASELDEVAVIGIGRPAQIGAVVRDCADRLAATGTAIAYALCCTSNRYWAVPDDGTPHPVPYALTGSAFDACARELGSRPFAGTGELTHSLAPATGQTALAMKSAIVAVKRTFDLIYYSPLWPHQASVAFFHTILQQCRTLRGQGQPLTPEDAALLCVTLDDPRMLELAVALCSEIDADPIIGMWSDLTRLAPPSHRSIAAALLAWTALATHDRCRADIARDIARRAAEPDTRILPEVDHMAETGQTPPHTPGCLDAAANDVAEATIARFSLHEVQALAEATLACSEFVTHPDDEGRPGPQLWWRGRVLTSNGKRADPALTEAVDMRDPRGRLSDPNPPIPIAIHDGVLSIMREGIDRGLQYLQLLRCGHRTLVISAVDSAIDIEVGMATDDPACD